MDLVEFSKLMDMFCIFPSRFVHLSNIYQNIFQVLTNCNVKICAFYYIY